MFNFLRILLALAITGHGLHASAQLIINEIAPAGTTLADEEGVFEDWVELYNAGESTVDLTGYYVSDDVEEPRKWQLPAGLQVLPKGYLLLWADDDRSQGPAHLNFSLKKSGESFLLTDPSGSLVTRVTFPAIPFRASYAHRADGSYETVGAPSPLSLNPTGVAYLSAPRSSLREGAHAGAQSITLSSEAPGSIIYYTLDGALPTSASAVYTEPLALSKTAAIRTMATAPAHAPSPVADYTYLIDDPLAPGMTATMVTTDPRNLFDDGTGIYVVGTNGVVQYCAFDGKPANYFRDWERPASFQLITDDGRVAFDVNAETSIGGVCSRTLPVKTLNISLKEKTYGDDAIEYRLFPQRGKIKYERIRLRNSGQDWGRTLMRDMVNQNLLFGYMDLDIQLGRPTAMYLNGVFWGLHNLRERLRPQYFEELYDVREKELILIKSPGLPYAFARSMPDTFTELQTVAIYDTLYRWVESADFTREVDAARFAAEVDINSLLNYWSTMTYLNGHDWPANNLFVWKRYGDPTAKWRYVVDDTDVSSGSSLSPGGETLAGYNNLVDVLSESCEGSTSCDRRATLFLRKALARPEWRAEFVQRMSTLMAAAYEPRRATAYIDSISALQQPYVTRQFERHPESWSGWDGAYPTFVADFKAFYELRPAAMRGFLTSAFDLGASYELTVNTDADTKGEVLLHSEQRVLPKGYRATYFSDTPLQLTARPAAGYRFDRWLETGVTDSVINYVGRGDATLTPLFSQVSAVGEAFAKTSFTVAPNPSSGKVRITDTEVAAGDRYWVIDLIGREVLSVPATGYTTELDLTPLAVGTYVLRKTGSGGQRLMIRQ